jgi:protein-S-isoprenylcysteine O-methyltransferase Ste14
MHALEHKIPPPVVCLLVGALMWAATGVAPAIAIDRGLRLGLAGTLAALGLVAGASGFLAFGRAKTTIDPVKIDAASALVTDGVYRYTRNPMYLGLAALLAGWAVYLATPWTLLGPIAFALYITRFQILPEERAMTAKFGAAYRDQETR